MNISTSPERLQRLIGAAFEHVDSPTLITDLRGRIIAANRAGRLYVERALGLVEVEGVDVARLAIGPEEVFRADFKTALSGGRLFLRSGGETEADAARLAFRAKPLRSLGGGETAVLLTADEQKLLRRPFEKLKSELRQANEVAASARWRARAATAELETVLATATCGIVGLSADRRIVSANPAARHMLGGVSAEPPFDWPHDIQFFALDDMRPLLGEEDPVDRVLRSEAKVGEIVLMSRKTSYEKRFVEISGAQTSHAASAVRGVLVIEDVTDRERSRQLAERSGRLDALGQLTGGIAHDFNNLLATILSALQVAQMQSDPEKARRFTEIALNSIDRGAALAGRLLSFARRQPANAVSRSVETVFADVLSLMRPTIEEAIDIRSVVEADQLVVFCDQAQLENALVNLMLNSRDAILRERKGDRITVEARGLSDLTAESEMRGRETRSFIAAAMSAEHRADHRRADGRKFRYIEIAVTDNGPGMAPEVKSRAVDPFFSTKGVNSGAGLGLSMVYGFVQQAGGELRIYSEIGLGTTVRMILPRGVEGGRREAPVERLPQPKGQGQTVLVVEDELDLLMAFSALVGSLGYEVITASNGSAALEILAKDGDRVDLLLTDIVMPGGVGGFELAERARADRPTLPVIYMSGYTGFSNREGAVQAPMLPKPCSPAELARVLAAALP